ncbi:hypothetical protein ECH_0685 [Ehrlichia chaffeensis str. Arkansas]|uniref:Uncharacterized protein n=1 Tax=Ehrlichia chaffeensis (strain ATCC CRL-10679 / Arkansas) TaxID=205920 RepID=Q2GGE2_EHRCR|nr:hypothetical protein ECH_0685 [Ehrlichia chaffeensis str. Arkansas]
MVGNLLFVIICKDNLNSLYRKFLWQIQNKIIYNKILIRKRIIFKVQIRLILSLVEKINNMLKVNHR